MSGIKLKYFVLNPFSSDKEYARASEKAILKFAEVIKETNSELAEDLIGWINKTYGDIS